MKQTIENIRILVVRLSSIGDVLLTTPLIRILRKRYPGSIIDFLTFKENSILLDNNIRLDNVYQISKNRKFSEWHRILPDDKYDIIIDLQNSFKSKITIAGAGHKIYKFNKRRFYKLKLVWLKKRQISYELIPELYINSVSELNIEPDGEGLEFWLEGDKNSGSYTPRNNNPDGKIIGIAPGAYHFTKRWPLEKFKELVILINNNLDSEIYFLGGKKDENICSELLSFAKKAKNFAGQSSLSETAALIGSCSAVVTNDTAIMHIAASRQIPCVAIFGSTVPEFGFTPYKSKYTIIENDTKCRPCTHYGRDKCPKEHFKCMIDINSDLVFSELAKIMIS